jgi:predicted methyltransferase
VAATEALHRMDEDVAKQEIESAGFKLAAEGKDLANQADDDTKRVFEEGEHDHTDQFLLKFRKP